MTDKDTIDYCKNCSVEPPAMKFKCPECKYNPNKEQAICKYKFQDKEKFDGKPYCTCFCELCEDLPLCDDNCQIYEDYKRLTCKTSECEEQENKIKKLRKNLALEIELTNRYRKALEEIEKQCKCYGRSKYTKEFDREYGGELDTNILDIITKAKDGE